MVLNRCESWDGVRYIDAQGPASTGIIYTAFRRFYEEAVITYSGTFKAYLSIPNCLRTDLFRYLSFGRPVFKFIKRICARRVVLKV
jgi:hypothetical protein